MRKLDIISNTTDGTIREEHTLNLPIACCPVSKNPRSGSTVTISYHPCGCSLEIASLYAYLDAYRGGLRDDTGELIVRDMEGMVIHIANDCAEILQVDVQVVAEIWLTPKQEMKLTVIAGGEKEEDNA